MELKLLRLKNFLSFEELAHSFKSAPVLIKGKNLTETESQETNGAGKSTLEAGIAFAILAASLRKQTLDKDLIRWGEEEAHIWLDIYCPIRKQNLHIHRTLRVKGSQLLELTVNEEPVRFATVSDGNAFILNWIGISAADLKNYYLINKENFKSFVSSSNAERLALISRFIKAERLDKADEVIKDKNKPLEIKARDAALQVAKIEGELNVYKEQLAMEAERNLEQERSDKIENLNAQMDGMLARYDKAEGLKKNAELTITLANEKIKTNQQKLLDLNRALSALNKSDFALRYKKVESERTELDTELTTQRTELNEARSNSEKLKLEIQRLQGVLNGTVVCPKCQHEFAIAEPNTDLEDVRDKVEKSVSAKNFIEELVQSLKTEVDKFTTQFRIFDEKISTIRKEEQENIRNTRALQSDITKIEYAIRDNENLVVSSEQEIARLTKILEECNVESENLLSKIEKVETEVFETREEELQGIVALTEKKLAKALAEKENQEKQVADNIQWGLRIKEFKMSLACEQLRIIQNFANIALQKQHSELRLSIDGFKRTAGGKIKEEITVTVINSEGEYKPFWSFSGGERARIEVALIQAFQEMINGTNEWGGLHFLMIDEVLEGTDPLGLALLLESLDAVGYPVYIISHVMNIRAGVETITIVKENGKSYIE